MDLAEEACQIWIDADGADKVVYLMPLVPAFADERCVNHLVKAVKSWCKKRKQKASAAIQWMAKTPGNFGIAQVKALHESRKFSESIMNSAEQALLNTATSRGISLEDLIDEIVPGFGLSKDGVRLNVGPYCYQVKVLPDLSLKVINDQGKSTKTLPKARASEDADKRSVAENQFKALRKNLKPIFKQQASKLEQAMQSDKRWTAARWNKLFIDHPVLALLAQGLTWSQVSQEGHLQSLFRPSEDGSLINTEDEIVALKEDAFVRVTHPVEVDESVRQQWIQHFDDYALTPPIEQWQTPVTTESDEEIEKIMLDRHQGHVIDRGSFSSLLKKWGYVQGPSGDGGRISDHNWKVDNERFIVKLHHSDMSAWFEADEQIGIDHFAVYQKQLNEADNKLMWKEVNLGKLPKALLSTLLTQSEELANRGSGFQSKWRSL